MVSWEISDLKNETHNSLKSLGEAQQVLTEVVVVDSVVVDVVTVVVDVSVSVVVVVVEVVTVLVVVVVQTNPSGCPE